MFSAAASYARAVMTVAKMVRTNDFQIVSLGPAIAEWTSDRQREGSIKGLMTETGPQ